jgi:hypothetical protein
MNDGWTEGPNRVIASKLQSQMNQAVADVAQIGLKGSSQGSQLEVYTLHSLLHAIQQRLTLVVMLFCGG